MHTRAKASTGTIQAQLGLCAAAIAGTAAVSNTAEAVVVTTFQSTMIPIPATLAGVYLDFNNGTTGTSAFPGWDFNPYQTSSGLGFYWGTDLVGGARAGGVETAAGSNLDADYAATGGPVGPAQTFTSAIQGASLNYRTTGLHRLPLRFVNGAILNYGYVDIQTTTGAGNQAGFPATIKGWVFDNSGAAMQVPPIPEPSSASLLALVAGAAGLRGWRRSRSA